MAIQALTPEQMMQQGMRQRAAQRNAKARTGGDVALNLLAGYFDKKGAENRLANQEAKQRATFSEIGRILQMPKEEQQAAAFDSKDIGAQDWYMANALGGEQGGVSKTFVGENGNMWFLNKNGLPTDTGSKVSDTYKYTDEGLAFGSRSGALSKPEQIGQVLTGEEIQESRDLSIENKAKEKNLLKTAELRATDSAETSKNATKQITNLNGSIRNFRLAIAELDKGADVGILAKYAPSITKASATLDNLRDQMGLDVIAAVTFGALSKAEMEKAMAIASPPNLDEDGLREWFTDKAAAQEKLRDFYMDVAKRATQEGKTGAEIFIEMQEEKKNSPKKVKASDMLKDMKARLDAQ